MTAGLLLTRDQFREGVFARDGYRCVICKAAGLGADGQVVSRPAKLDAHHVIERRLFPDGGYYLDNGASLCGSCHIKAESTALSCEEIREAAGITRLVLPPHLYEDTELRFDKWGNLILPDGRRSPGELMGDESVRKIMDPAVEFVRYVKYPRTFHLPWSPGLTKDDRVLPDTSHFEGQEVVVTLKMDGENTTMYRDHIHARSIDSKNHVTRNWVKAMHARIAHEIPEAWRLCGENLYAKHSIYYSHLPSYFMLFSIWDERNHALSWDATIEWAELLDLQIVPVLYRGVWDEKVIRSLWTPKVGEDEMEGYVVRLASGFAYKDFRRSVAKFVRANHVHTHGHWMREVPKPNGLTP